MENEKEIFEKVLSIIEKRTNKEYEKFTIGNKHNYYAWLDFEELYKDLFREYFATQEYERNIRLAKLEEQHEKI